MSVIRIVHLTDPHLTLPDPRDGIRGKRRLGYLSWRKKRRFRHSTDVLEHVCQAVQAEDPAQILITGDLLQIGLPGEAREAREWLEHLAPPERIALVLGNHDLYARDSWSNLRTAWAPYLNLAEGGSESNGQRPPETAYPWVRNLACADAIVRIVALNSAWVSPLFMASGALGEDQRARLNALVDDADAFHCVLLHHPPIPRTVSWRKSLRDARALYTDIPRSSAGVVLHGHTHRNSYDGELGAMRVFGTASASSTEVGREASYRVFDIRRTDAKWHVAMTLKQVATDGAIHEHDTVSW